MSLDFSANSHLDSTKQRDKSLALWQKVFTEGLFEVNYERIGRVVPNGINKVE
jgi:hypothetical protein